MRAAPTLKEERATAPRTATSTARATTSNKTAITSRASVSPRRSAQSQTATATDPSGKIDIGEVSRRLSQLSNREKQLVEAMRRTTAVSAISGYLGIAEASVYALMASTFNKLGLPRSFGAFEKRDAVVEAARQSQHSG